MPKEDILLRATSNPPLTTKGSALTWAELDANFIEIYNAYKALSQSSYVPDYDNAVEYDDTVNNYATYSSQIWKFINPTPATNVTPTEGATWTKVYATDLVNRPLPIDGVKRYKALLSQSGTYDAAITVLVNTLGVVPTCTYNGVGEQIFNLITHFNPKKTIIRIGHIKGNVSQSDLSVGLFKIYTRNDAGTLYDDKLNNTPIEIEVYP